MPPRYPPETDGMKWTSPSGGTCSRRPVSRTWELIATEIPGRSRSPSHNRSRIPGNSASSWSTTSRTVAASRVSSRTPCVNRCREAGMKTRGMAWSSCPGGLNGRHRFLGGPPGCIILKRPKCCHVTKTFEKHHCKIVGRIRCITLSVAVVLARTDSSCPQPPDLARSGGSFCAPAVSGAACAAMETRSRRLRTSSMCRLKSGRGWLPASTYTLGSESRHTASSRATT